MNKLIALLSVLSLLSCAANKAVLEQQTKNQAEAGDRINNSQKNTDSLFKELE